MLPVMIVGKTIDSLQKIDHTFYLLIGSLIALILLKLLIYPWQTKNLYRLVLEANRDISVNWTQAILHKEYHFFQSANVGKLLRQSERGILAHERLLTIIITFAIPNIIELAVISLYLVFIANLQMMIPVIIAAIIFVSFSVYGIARRRPYIDAVNHAEDMVSEHFSSTLLAARSIKIFGAWKKSTSLLENAYHLYAQSAKKLNFVATLLSTGQSSIILLTQITTLITAIVVSNYSPGILVVVFIYSGFFMDRIASLVAIYKELDQYKADQQEISAILVLPDFRTSKANNKLDNYDITIKPFAREKLTNQHTIYIPYGAHVAIIGSTGEGKTTLANIIAGTLKTNNIVHIGTSDIANLSEKAMVNTISYAYQDPDFLLGDFNNSILFNTLKIKPKKLKSLLVDLQLDKTLDIQHLNQNIPVSTLSGGEAKRLALLRTLITKKTYHDY